MQRLAAIALDAGVARKLAQMLAVGRRMQREQLVERRVAFVDQPRTPCFEPMQRGGLLMRFRAIVVERGAHRLDIGFIEFAQLLGEKLRRALARDVRGDGARAHDLGTHVVGERHARELGIAERSERFGELEHFERLAALLAPARRKFFVG